MPPVRLRTDPAQQRALRHRDLRARTVFLGSAMLQKEPRKCSGRAQQVGDNTAKKCLKQYLRDEVVTVKTIERLLLHTREQLKIHEHAFLESNQVIFSDEVRSLCERNACGMYGKSWACPPGVGSVADCKARCREFHHALIFTSLSPLRKKHDISGWQEARIRHETMTESAVSIVRSQFDRILALSTEGCMVCESCAYPNKPCRFPERMFPAIEGFGINVMQLAKTCGIKYYNGPNTVTYFSIIFF